MCWHRRAGEEELGRRPLSAKRHRFMVLCARRFSLRAAAREVGVPRSAVTNWTRGYKVVRSGVEVPPLDRLEHSISAHRVVEPPTLAVSRHRRRSSSSSVARQFVTSAIF
ncbi:helix-turn-helix domain-containing protein [Mycolicibacterium iranicum]|uniref:helix-turn-helix domain-containing protein n=2 Tax=Mycolicibacterium iranicum TaxID=912594 RepID=UPI003B3A077B